MSNTAQCRNMPEGASGSSTTRTRLPVSAGTSDHDNGGEISAPSQVYCAGISPLGGIAGLASIRGMTSPHCSSFTLQIEIGGVHSTRSG